MRQSVSHTGSFFFVEMWRMVSSLKPGGVDSDSTSVTKPYLYSCLTRLSMVSVAVLIVLKLFFFVAIWAGAMDGDVKMFCLEPLGQFHRLRGQIHVKNRSAGIAMKMTMLVHVRAITRRAALQRDLPGQAAFSECIEAVIGRGVGNLRHLPLGTNEDLLGGRMIALVQQHGIDLLALRRQT